MKRILVWVNAFLGKHFMRLPHEHPSILQRQHQHLQRDSKGRFLPRVAPAATQYPLSFDMDCD